MQTLNFWSFWKVLLVSGGWVLLSVLLLVAWVSYQFRSLMNAPPAGSGGIGAVSLGINVFMLLIPFGPPIVLFLAWLIARRS